MPSAALWVDEVKDASAEWRRLENFARSREAKSLVPIRLAT